MAFLSRTPPRKPSTYLHSLFYSFISTSSATPHCPFRSFLTKECGFSQSELRGIHKSIKALETEATNNLQALRNSIRLLHEYGFEGDQVKKIIKRWPTVLRHDIKQDIIPRLDQLKDAGMTPRQVLKAATRDPRFMTRSPSCPNIKPYLQNLSQIYITKASLFAALQTHPMLLYTGMTSTVVPCLKLLKASGIPSHSIQTIITRKPSVLTLRASTLGEKIHAARSLGISPSSKPFVDALVAVCHMNVQRLQGKVMFLQGLGFSAEEISDMILRFPLLISVSPGKLEKAIRFLLQFTSYDVIVKNVNLFHYSIEKNLMPRYEVNLFHYSIEKNLMPRYEVIKWLRERDCRVALPSPVSVVRMNEKVFLDKYVKGNPHCSELLEIYKGFLGKMVGDQGLVSDVETRGIINESSRMISA